MDNAKEKLLITRISELQLSDDCVTGLNKLNVSTLKDLDGKGWQSLRDSDGFSYIWFNELVRFLGKCDILDLLENFDRHP